MTVRRLFTTLSPREVLSLAMDIEKNNAERLRVLAESFDDYDEQLQEFFRGMQEEELRHLALLEEVWRGRFGHDPPPDVKEEDVLEVVEAVEVDHGEHLLFDDVTGASALSMVLQAEHRARRFYETAADNAGDVELESLYRRLAAFEADHLDSLSNRDRIRTRER